MGIASLCPNYLSLEEGMKINGVVKVAHKRKGRIVSGAKLSSAYDSRIALRGYIASAVMNVAIIAKAIATFAAVPMSRPLHVPSPTLAAVWMHLSW